MDQSAFKRWRFEYEDYESESEDYYESEEYVEGFNELLRSLNIMCVIVYCLVFVVGVLGNGVVIWVTGFKLKKTINTVWFLNLAVADFLYIAFLPLGMISKAIESHWPFGRLMCKLYYGAGNNLAMFASAYILVVISVYRCVSVVWPAWVQNHRSVRKASYVSLGVWVLALVFSAPNFIFMDVKPCDQGHHHNGTENSTYWCFGNYVFSNDSESPAVVELREFRKQAMIISYFLVGYVFPLAIIVSCYAVIIHQLRRSRSLASHWGGRPFKITAAVIIAFLLCLTPMHIMEIIYTVSPEETLIRLVWFYIGLYLEALSHCLNPLLYLLMVQDFKNKACQPILNVLESAFTEEEPQSKPSTNLSLSDA